MNDQTCRTLSPPDRTHLTGSGYRGGVPRSSQNAPLPLERRAARAAIIAHGPPDRRSLIWGIAGAGIYFALALLCLSLSRFDIALAAVWLPGAFAVTFMLRTRLANEAALFAALIPASVYAYALGGYAFDIAVIFAFANMACVVAVIGLIRRNCDAAPDISDVRTLAWVVLSGALAGPLLSTFLAAPGFGANAGISAGKLGLLELADISAQAIMRDDALRWFLAESMGMGLIVAPALLVADALRLRHLPDRETAIEGVVLLGCTFLCTLLVFGQTAYPLLFLILPMTMVHAFRLGSLGTVLHVAVVAAVSGTMTWAGHGPFVETSASPSVQWHLVQAFMAFNLLAGLPIAAVLAGRERLTHALNEGRRELALLANSITDAVLKLDQDGVCTYASPAVRDVLGEQPEALIGRPLDELTQEDASDRIANVLRRLLDGKSEKERLTYRRRLDDAGDIPVYIEADCAVALDPVSGERAGVIVSARDVTERVELELLLTRARRHAEKAASAKSDFLANMSHEIRTPMNGVLGFAELMLQGELDPEQRRHMEMIVESGRSMMLLLNDILDLSKIEAGQIMIDPSPIDLHATLDECVSLHRQSAKKKGLALRLEYELGHARCGADGHAQTDTACANLLPTVVTDGLRLRQIALNLISNAVKFTQNGEVTVSYWTREDELCVRVRDTGIGISPTRLDKIFRPFTQGDSGTSQRFGGTGLGLSISRQLAELLGGRIEVESVAGVGSTFTLTLPATIIEECRPTPAIADPPSPADLPPEARILLVEDHDVNRLLVTEMLERCGQSVAIAHDGNEAISMVMDSVLRERPFDLVLMDVQMPDCDGYEATRAIRQEGIGPETLPIVALTANAFPEDVAQARAAGMQAHLAKPIVFADLAKALQRWLPTRIVEAPMDRDVAPGASVHPEDSNTDSGSTKLHTRWLARRSEAVEAIRRGLANGLVGNTNKRRARDRSERDELLSMIHKLAGSAASFGEAGLGEQATALEEAMSKEEPGDRCEALAFALLAHADEPAAPQPD